MNKKALMIALDVILYAIGFPILLIIAIVYSLPYLSTNIYGLTAATPIILVVVAWLATGVSELAVRLVAKKKMDAGAYPDKKKALRSQGIRLIISIFCCLTIFTCFLDIVLPPLLNTATQGTILYEDILLDDGSQNEAQQDLFKTFVTWNVENGNLNKKTLAEMESFYAAQGQDEAYINQMKTFFINASKDYRSNDSSLSGWERYGFNAEGGFAETCKDKIINSYLSEAMNNEEIQTVLKKCFNTIDAAYQTFDPLTIELALENLDYLFNYNHDWLNDLMLVIYGDENGEANKDTPGDLTTGDYLYMWCIVDLLGEVPNDPMVEDNMSLLEPMWKLYTDKNGVKTTHNEARGVLDYMSMAWMDSITLLGIVSVTKMRLWFYFFSAIIMVAGLVRYFIVRPSYYGVSLCGCSACGNGNGDDTVDSNEVFDMAKIDTAVEDKKAKKAKKSKKNAPAEAEQNEEASDIILEEVTTQESVETPAEVPNENAEESSETPQE